MTTIPYSEVWRSLLRAQARVAPRVTSRCAHTQSNASKPQQFDANRIAGQSRQTGATPAHIPAAKRPSKVKRPGVLTAPTRAAGPSSGRVTAITTAEEYSLSELQKCLARQRLIGGRGGTLDSSSGRNSAAINLLGEAIYLPHWDQGEAFLFEDGSVVLWQSTSSPNDVSHKESMSRLLECIIESPRVQTGPYGNDIQEETLDYSLQPK